MAIPAQKTKTRTSPLTIQTAAGPVTGGESTDGKVRMFKGIPFAAAPVGNLRWKPPQPPAHWAKAQLATAFGPRCMQGRIYTDMIFRDQGPSENCLSLNVWTPARSATAKLPVMVWIFGGGFAAGGTSEPRQDGEALAHKDVIVVSMNYRLGIFGFFAHPALAEESPQHATGNYGLMDQQAALLWVKENIAAFGGDPDNITIFGESAGSMSVSAQIASPLSKDLITRAIGESGALFGRAGRNNDWKHAAELDQEFARDALGTDSLPALRAKPASTLLEAAVKERQKVHFSAVVDGYFLPEAAADIYENGRQAHIPLLAGFNAEEQGPGSVFGKGPETAAAYKEWVTKRFGEKTNEVLKVYPADSDEQTIKSAGTLASDLFIAFGTWKWIEVHAATSGSPVYRYRFDDAPPMKSGPSRGAYHSAEIEFVFGNLDHKDLPWRESDRKLSELMSTYWSNFAKTGDPNGQGLPAWPTYNHETNFQVMHLDTASKAMPADDRDRLEVLNKVGPPKSGT